VFTKLEKLFSARSAGAHREVDPERATALAVAVLMVEAAQSDGSFDDIEATKTGSLLQKRFCLDAEDANDLLTRAKVRAEESVELFGFTRQIKDHFSEEERIELMEMLWELAYADGQLHDLEASLMRRLAGLLYVSDRDSGDARKRALRRLDQSSA
jgi:uncharacterized tellurite resistance protein B-like protein